MWVRVHTQSPRIPKPLVSCVPGARAISLLSLDPHCQHCSQHLSSQGQRHVPLTVPPTIVTHSKCSIQVHTVCLQVAHRPCPSITWHICFKHDMTRRLTIHTGSFLSTCCGPPWARVETPIPSYG